ncbi:MAG: hypothetical protein WCC60_07815 [Ilumatobacteraceae bacterium]
MRDAFDEIDLIEIEFIDADPTAFGPQRASEPAPPRERPTWLVPAALGVLAALITGALFAAWRSRHEPWTIRAEFPASTATATPALGAQLVFGDPPDTLSAASLGVEPGGADSGLDNLEGAIGYFFGAPGATIGFGQSSTGRWAAFFAVPADRADAPSVDGGDGTTTITVQSAPGQLRTSVGNRTIEVVFGPVDGQVFSVVTSELTQQETLAFAEAVSVDGTTARVSDSTVLSGLRPVGSIADFTATFGVIVTASDPATPREGIVSTQYGPEGGRVAVTSLPATDHAYAMLRFFLGDAADATVHGLPAVAFAMTADDPLLASNRPGTIVAWIEGGRLIVVSGSDGPVTTTALAETVRPATDAEWTEVERVAGNTIDQSEQFGDNSDGTGFAHLDFGAMPDTSISYTFSAMIDGADIIMTVTEENASGELVNRTFATTPASLPVLSVNDFDGVLFVIGIVDRAEADNPELRMTLADGTQTTRPCFDYGEMLPGPACGTLFPDDAAAVELWNGGEMVWRQEHH